MRLVIALAVLSVLPLKPLLVPTLAAPLHSFVSSGDVAALQRKVLRFYRAATGLNVNVAGAVAGTQMYQLGNLDTGYAMEPADTELFFRLASVLAPRHIYAVGNAWGYSTIMLATIFNGSQIDVIEAGLGGRDSLIGVEITQRVAASLHPDAGNVRITVGRSPGDVAKALRTHGRSYELVFIDGQHSNEQLALDFDGIEPYLANRFVVVLHDVGMFNLHSGVQRCLCRDVSLRYVSYVGRDYTSHAGTGFLYRGFPDDVFVDFGVVVAATASSC